MPRSWNGESGSVMLRHLAEEVLDFIVRLAGVSRETFVAIASTMSLLALSDTPDSYEGKRRRLLRVKSSESGIEYADGDVVFRCHVKTTGNVNLASPPTVVDTITLGANYSICVGSQTNQVENGIYLAPTVGGAWVRYSLDAEDWQVARITLGATNGGTLWEVVWDGEIVVGTDPVVWRKLNPSTGITGTGSTNTKPYWTSTSALGVTDSYFNNSDNLHGYGGPSTTAKLYVVHAGNFIGLEVNYSGGNTASKVRTTGSGIAFHLETANTNSLSNTFNVVSNGRGNVANIVHNGAAGYTVRASNDGSGLGTLIQSTLTTGTAVNLQVVQKSNAFNAEFKHESTTSTKPNVRLWGTHAGLDLSMQGGLGGDVTTVNSANLTLTARHRLIAIQTPNAQIILTLPTLSADNEGIEYYIHDIGNNLATANRNCLVRRSGTDLFADGTSTDRSLITNRGCWIVRHIRDSAGNRRWFICPVGAFGV